MFGPKYFGLKKSQKKFGCEKFWVQKIFESELNFGSERIQDPKKMGQKIFLVRKKFWSDKMFGLENTGPEKIVGLKTFVSEKNLSTKKCGSKTIPCQKKLFDSKIFVV